MKNILLAFSVLIFTSASEKLYYYGPPDSTTETGFVKLDTQTNVWEPFAEGWTTRYLDHLAVKGITLSKNVALLYGKFDFCNGTYVNSIVKLDFETKKISKFNDGVLGDITSAVYYNNDTQVAMMGSFTQFFRNTPANHVGSCSADGNNCSSLGNGFQDYSKFVKGELRSLGGTLFAKYSIASHMIIACFDTSRPTGEWQVIFKTTERPDDISIQVYRDQLWMFGNFKAPNQQNVSAAKWNSSQSRWEYMYNSQSPDQLFANRTFYGRLLTVVSPNGRNVYIWKEGVKATVFYQWSVELWSLLGEVSYVDSVTANNEELLVACNHSVIALPQKNIVAQLVPYCNPFYMLSDGYLLHCFCRVLGTDKKLKIYSYNVQRLTSYVELRLEEIEWSLHMCVYGNKMMVTGSFEKAGNQEAPVISVWDNDSKQWYKVIADNMLYLVHCRCDSIGENVAAVCARNEKSASAFLLLDHARSDSGIKETIQNVPQLDLTQLEAIHIDHVQFVGTSLFFSTRNETHGTLSQWSQQKGLQILFTVNEQLLYFAIVENSVYLVAATKGNEISNATIYNLVNGAWHSLGHISYHPWYSLIILYWNNNMYFNRHLGTKDMSAWKRLQYDMDANFRTFCGAANDYVLRWTSGIDKLYFIDRKNCSLFRVCGDLWSYEPHSKRCGIIARNVFSVTTTRDFKIIPIPSLPVLQTSNRTSVAPSEEQVSPPFLAPSVGSNSISPSISPSLTPTVTPSVSTSPVTSSQHSSSFSAPCITSETVSNDPEPQKNSKYLGYISLFVLTIFVIMLVSNVLGQTSLQWKPSHVHGITNDNAGNIFFTSPYGLFQVSAGAGVTKKLLSARSLKGLVWHKKQNKLFICDEMNHKVLSYAVPNGPLEEFAGTGDIGQQDGEIAKATFRNPYGISVDNKGDLIVMEMNNVRKIDLLPGTVRTAQFSMLNVNRIRFSAVATHDHQWTALQNLVSEWRILGERLGKQKNELDNIEKKASLQHKFPLDLLLLSWQHSEHAFIDVLVRALQDIDNQDAADLIKSWVNQNQNH